VTAYTLYRAGRAPNAFMAGFLSFLVPGTGQLYAGRLRRGITMLAVTLVVAAAVLAVWLQGSIFVLRLVVQPDVLLALLVANALFFVFHVHCVVDAYRGARRPSFPPRATRSGLIGHAALVAALLALTVAPHLVAAYYDYRSYDLLTSVFADEEPESPLLAAAIQPEPTPPAEVTPSPAVDPAAGPEAPAGADEPPPPTEPADDRSTWHERGRVTFLLVGGDAGPGRSGLRTDTMMVLSVDPSTERAALFGVPRNLADVPLPRTAHTDLDVFPDILNALWGYATANPELFPGSRVPGATALKETIGGVLGLRIDYYAAVDLRGFVEVIDALGGVTVNVQKYVYDAGVSPPYEDEPWIVVDLEPGRHHMDGRLALGYARTRWATSDYDRMRRQRCILGALEQQASPARILRSFPKLASVVKRFMLTDVPIKELPDLIELLTRLSTAKTVAVSFAPSDFAAGWRDGYPIPDVELIRQTVKQALKREPALAAGNGLETLKTGCL
jgi:LCP family protein required for cell wall assembly